MTMQMRVRHWLGLDYADEANVPPEQKKGMTRLFWNGVFGMFSENAAANYTNLFLISLNASNTQIGLLNTLVQIATAIMPLPGATLAERTGRYRAIIFYPNVVARIFFLVLAALPLMGLWLAPSQAGTLVVVAIGLLVLRALITQFTTAPWTAFVGKLVPINIRANYFSARTFAMSVASMLGTLVAGQLIARFTGLVGFQLVFVVACGVGLVASWLFAGIPRSQFPSAENKPATTNTTPTTVSLFALFKRNPAFARYTVAAGALALAVGIGGPFIQVYQAKVLGFDAGTIGLIVTAEALSSLLAGRLYGTIIFNRYGDFRVMRVLRMLTALVPFGWIFIQSPLAGVLNQILSGAIWSGHELAAFNGLLSVTPEEGRAKFIGFNSLVVAICAALGPALGGVLTEVIGYQPLFALSTVLRMGAGLLCLALVQDWNKTRQRA